MADHRRGTVPGPRSWWAILAGAAVVAGAAEARSETTLRPGQEAVPEGRVPSQLAPALKEVVHADRPIVCAGRTIGLLSGVVQREGEFGPRPIFTYSFALEAASGARVLSLTVPGYDGLRTEVGFRPAKERSIPIDSPRPSHPRDGHHAHERRYFFTIAPTMAGRSPDGSTLGFRFGAGVPAGQGSVEIYVNSSATSHAAGGVASITALIDGRPVACPVAGMPRPA